MLAGTLLLLAFLALPTAGGQTHFDDAEPVVVEGRVELSPAEADASARDRADLEARWQLERRAGAVISSRAPLWLPGFVAGQIRETWLRGVSFDRTYDVVDLDREQHDHGTYRSFRTRLSVVANDRAIDRVMASLDQRLRLGARRFAWVLGGTAGLWAFLGLAYGWLDRLTRGYMPWRLRLICVGMAFAGPGIALLFV